MKNSIKNVILVVFVSIISMGAYQYYQNYNEARSFNNFLDSAALISSLHLEASEEFKNILDCKCEDPQGKLQLNNLKLLEHARNGTLR